MSSFFKSIFIIFLLNSCGIYSFTGASISSDVKTVQVDVFPNHAAIVNPQLSQQFTQSLQDLFLTRTNLTLVSNDGDLVFEGEITDYSQTSISPTGDNTSAQIRFTIEVNVRFTNNKESDKNFEKKFKHYEDVSSTSSISGSLEQQIVDSIIETILEQIFNDSVASW